MESSKVIIHGGEEEECSSSESGWTAYIASTYDDSSNSSSERKGYKNYKNDYVEEDGESDDSMASDASSGPSHHEYRPLQSPLIRSHVQGKDNRRNGEHNKKAEKMKSRKDEQEYKGKSLLGNAFSRGKTRKNK